MISITIRFTRMVGDIPEGTLGILHMGLEGLINYTRVFVPRRYVGLDENTIPCYDMPDNDGSWVEIEENALTDAEKKELSELDEEILDKEKMYIGPDGMLIKTLGIEL